LAEQRVLADALGAAQDNSVIDLLVRPLDPMSEPRDDVIGVVAVDFANMIEPWTGFSRVAQFDRGRTVQVEATHLLPLDPSTA
jgi:hypothetical protein